MLYKKEGTPEDGEIVVCTVTQINYNSVFARMDEYDNTGMIHISEIAPGRIRNIRDFVKEGKIIVCKVLKTYYNTGHIDLSLRRVTEITRRKKLDEMKQEQKSEKIIEIIAKQMKVDMKVLYDQITEKVFAKYASLTDCFNEVSKGTVKLEDLGLEKSIADTITEIVSQKIKPLELLLKGDFLIVSYDPKGVEAIKESLSLVNEEDISIRYIKAGQYRFEIKGIDYKPMEERMKKYSDLVCSYANKHHAEAKFVKIEEK